jgi:hypothetical protein
LVRSAIVIGGLLLALCAWQPARAGVNPEGVSGVLNTPTAEVVNDGVAVVTMGRFLRRMEGGLPDSITRSYSVTVGYLPRLELTARFIDFPTVPDTHGTTNFQDRSASMKYRIPLNERWAAALGVTDVGGESQINQGAYGVLTYQASEQLSLSAGAGTERLSGAFANARWSPHERITLLGEYDTQDVNYGVEIKPFKGLALTAGMVNGHSAFSGSYTFPLDPRGPASPCAPVKLEPCAEEYACAGDQAAAVRDALIAESYENVLVGIAGDTLYIECESRRFVEQVDALAVAAAVAVKHAGPGVGRIEVSPKIEDIPQLTFSAAVNDYIAFMADPGAGAQGLCVAPYEPGRFPPETVFACEGNKKPGHGEVQVRPLSSFEITRPGQPTFMTKWGLGLDERVYLARGLKLQARQEWPLMNDIEHQDEKTKPYNRDAILSYLAAPKPGLFVQGVAGYFGDARLGAFGEAGWYLAPGRFKLGASYGYVHNGLTDASDKEDGLALANASYFVPDLDLDLALIGGQFLKGDRGLRFESTRSFGPLQLKFFAYDTNESSAHGGFQFFVPLPWYSERRHGAWRVVGAPVFAYQYRTDSDPWGDTGPVGWELETARQRLRPDYVAAHLDQFRRAVQLYTHDS